MSRKKQHQRKQNGPYRLRAFDDIHLAFAPRRPDPIAWAESIDTVARKDRKWLRRHPDAPCRKRPITAVEMRMTGLPADTIVVVGRGPDGSQIRAFCTGDEAGDDHGDQQVATPGPDYLLPDDLATGLN